MSARLIESKTLCKVVAVGHGPNASILRSSLDGDYVSIDENSKKRKDGWGPRGGVAGLGLAWCGGRGHKCLFAWVIYVRFIECEIFIILIYIFILFKKM